MFQLKQAKVMTDTDFFISRPGLYVIQFCAFRNVCLLVDVSVLHLRDGDYPAASRFPNVNCILSRRRNAHDSNVIVLFQPLQAKQ